MSAYKQEGVKRQKVEADYGQSDCIIAPILQDELPPVKVEEQDSTSMQRFKALPLTEKAQTQMSKQIKRLKSDIVTDQVRLRHLVVHISSDTGPSATIKRAIMDVLETPIVVEVKVSFVGPTGAGKSRAISALLDMEDITESSGVGSATTTLRLQFGENLDKECECQAVFHFIGKDAFRDIIDVVYDSLTDNNSEHETAHGPVAKVMAYSAKSLPELLSMKTEAEQGGDEKKARSLFADEVLACGPVELFLESEKHRYKCWQDLRDDVKGKLSASPCDGKVRWPILYRVQHLINHDTFKDGLVAEDTPGNGDFDAANDQIGLTAGDESNAIVLVVPMSRANSNKDHWNQVRKAIRRLYQQGDLHKIILVCTFADGIDIDQTVRKLQLTPEKERYEKLCAARDRKASLERLVGVVNTEYDDKCLHIGDSNHDIARWNGQLRSLNAGSSIRGPRTLQSRLVSLEGPLTDSNIKCIIAKHKAIIEEYDTKRRKLDDERNEHKSQLQELTEMVGPLELTYKRCTYEACTKHVAEESADTFIKLVKGEEDRSLDHAKKVCPSVLSHYQSDAYWANLREQASPIMLASNAHLHPNAPGTYIPREKTGIYDLALRMKAMNLVEQLEHLKALRNKTDAVLETLKRAVSTEAFDVPLSATAVASKLGFSVKLNNLPGDLELIVKEASVAFEEGFNHEFCSLLHTIQNRSLKRAQKRLDEYKDKCGRNGSEAKGLHVNEYRAATAPARQGVWEGKRVYLNFNDTVAAPIKMYVSVPLKAVFVSAISTEGSQKALNALPTCKVSLVQIATQLHDEFKLLADQGDLNASVRKSLDRQISRRTAIIKNIVDDAMRRLSKVYTNSVVSITADIRAAFRSGYAQAHLATRSGEGSKFKAAATLTHALDNDSIVSGAIDKLKERLQDKYTAVFHGLQQQMKDISESMRNDYTQTLQDHEAGFFKITDRKIKEEFKSELKDLDSWNSSEGKVRREPSVVDTKRPREAEDTDSDSDLSDDYD